MRTGRKTWQRFALLATSGVLALGAVGCGGPSDEGDDGSGGEASTTESSDDGGASDGGGASDDGGASDGGGVSDGGGAGDGGNATTDAGDYGPDIDLRTGAPPVEAHDAVATAQDEVGEGTRHAVELDYDEDAGAWQWDVKILDGTTDHKVVIDAVTGEVATTESDTTDDEEQAIDLDSPMPYDQALELATAERDGELRGWKLEYDDGMTQYQFDIVSGSDEDEVTVDAESGDVTVD
ncbi:MAG TPA: PepSY domain-containing protein [Brevibacterium sp.]|nr:PepSY domain-containing protein [Brevibacterium sp.]